MIHPIFRPYFWKILNQKSWIFGLVGFALMVSAVREIFWEISPDYLQGDLVKILFIHVPFAWMSMLIYGIMTVSSFVFLVFKLPLFSKISEAAQPIGAMFTLLTIMTGSIWGKAAWGAWWVWDARLTSVLLLFFLYLGCWALKSSIRNEEKRYKILSYYVLFGAFNLPIIKFSVDWWNTLHQPATLSTNAFKHLDSSYFLSLFLMFFALLFWSFFLGLVSLNKSLTGREG